MPALPLTVCSARKSELTISGSRLAGLNELFELEQIRIDLLKQLLSLVAEIRDELFSIKEFVRHHGLLYAEDGEQAARASPSPGSE